ncbi:MAG: hypothetical protein JEZ09_15335 [Salinivirgaceae bacterium]|nr:hypothetical protein [Salinivirgaceae bacterium]
MKKLTIILFASILAFASCNKDEDKSEITQSSDFKGSYTLNIDGKVINTLIKDVMYITDYNRVEIYGTDANNEIVTLYINDIPAENNEPIDASTNQSILLTYKGVMYSTANGSGTITRLNSSDIIFENIVANDLLGTVSKTFSGTAKIGRTESL